MLRHQAYFLLYTLNFSLLLLLTSTIEQPAWTMQMAWWLASGAPQRAWGLVAVSVPGLPATMQVQVKSTLQMQMPLPCCYLSLLYRHLPLVFVWVDRPSFFIAPLCFITIKKHAIARFLFSTCNIQPQLPFLGSFRSLAALLLYFARLETEKREPKPHQAQS